MNRPRSIKIGPSKWKVKYLAAVDGAVGLTFQTAHEIHICSTMPEQSIRSTLLHEVMHAVAWTYGFYPDPAELEESIISLFAAPLLTVLQENATLRNYLLPS